VTGRRVIVEAEYGSRAIGTATEDSDHDIMGVFIEPREYVTGIESTETDIENTAPEGQRSGRDDTDVTLYPLRKWASLAARGNPTVLSILFSPRHLHHRITGEWVLILRHRDAFISQEAGWRFLGYAQGQRQALTGQRNKRTNRPELIHRHGYDTKFAYHMLRTAMQGIELMDTGRMTLPMTGEHLAVLRDVRAGFLDKDAALGIADRLEADLRTAIAGSHLDEHADRSRINQLLHDIYEQDWNR
jgi:predicted nucleotidyltransferase